MGPVLLCARLGGMAVSAHRTQTRSVSAYRRPECLLKSRMCERHLSGSERAWAATFGEHPVYSTCALCCGSLPPGKWPMYRHESPAPAGNRTYAPVDHEHDRINCHVDVHGMVGVVVTGLSFGCGFTLLSPPRGRGP